MPRDEGAPRALRGDRRARRRRRGAEAPRLAQRADRQFLPVAEPDDQGERAVPPPGLHRTRRRRREPGDAFERRLFILRKVISSVIHQETQGRRPRLLSRVDVVADDRLQGHVPRLPARRLLPRPARSALRLADGAGASALLHQHVPVVEARASLPDGRAQRRDQHAARQRELDGGAAGLRLLAALRRRDREALADLLRGPVRHRLLRQRARVPDDGRLRARARRDDAHSRGVGRQPADG